MKNFYCLSSLTPLPFHVKRLTTLAASERLADCMLSTRPDHEWATAGTLVWNAIECLFEPKETAGDRRHKSAGGFCCDSGGADSGSVVTALQLNVKVITGPQLLWHQWKDAEPAV